MQTLKIIDSEIINKNLSAIFVYGTKIKNNEIIKTPVNIIKDSI